MPTLIIRHVADGNPPTFLVEREDGKTGPECKEVWMAGRKVQFRFPGADIPIEAVIRKQSH